MPKTRERSTFPAPTLTLAPEATTWANYLILTYPDILIIPLWVVPLPVIDPPLGLSVFFDFPSIGWIGIYSALATEAGPQAEELVWAVVPGGGWTVVAARQAATLRNRERLVLQVLAEVRVAVGPKPRREKGPAFPSQLPLEEEPSLVPSVVILVDIPEVGKVLQQPVPGPHRPAHIRPVSRVFGGVVLPPHRENRGEIVAKEWNA